MKRLVLLMLLLGGLIAAISLPVFALEGDVVVGGEVVMRVRVPAGGFSVTERVNILTERINILLGGNEFYPDRLVIKMVDSSCCIAYEKQLLVTVDAESARSNSCSVQQLADKWAINLRRVIPEAKAKLPTG